MSPNVEDAVARAAVVAELVAVRHCRHIKSGKPYFVTGVCLREVDLEVMVVYQRSDTQDGILWVRPAEEFLKRYEMALI